MEEKLKISKKIKEFIAHNCEENQFENMLENISIDNLDKLRYITNNIEKFQEFNKELNNFLCFKLK